MASNLMKINYCVEKLSVEKLERQVEILMGKKPNPIIPLWKIRNISLEITGDSVQGNLHKIDTRY